VFSGPPGNEAHTAVQTALWVFFRLKPTVLSAGPVSRAHQPSAAHGSLRHVL